MVAMTTPLWLTALLLLSCFSGIGSARRVNRRSDLVDVPPLNISAADWTVPLQGSITCTSNGSCIDALTAPALGKPLQYLAVARGIYTYTCTGGGPSEIPAFQAQSTQLYNAAPLVPHLANEATFHSLIPQLYSYDYAELQNSTLECMGTIGTINETAIVTLFDIATFAALPYESVLAPNDPTENGEWAHSVSPGRSWDVYRVEVAGGTPPTCGTEGYVFEKEYAAEYWFYHSTGEDLWTSINPAENGTSEKRKALI